MWIRIPLGQWIRTFRIQTSRQYLIIKILRILIQIWLQKASFRGFSESWKNSLSYYIGFITVHYSNCRISMVFGKTILFPLSASAQSTKASLAAQKNLQGIRYPVFEKFFSLKGTVAWDRFRQYCQKLTDVGLNKGRGWFLNFSEAPLIFSWNKTSSLR
jgi:hypothetical protein